MPPHPGQGGGIFDSSGELSLKDVVLKDDAATGSAGTAQRPNGGSAQGGGLYFSGDRLTISNSTFTGDAVTGGAGAVATVSGGNAPRAAQRRRVSLRQRPSCPPPARYFHE